MKTKNYLTFLIALSVFAFLAAGFCLRASAANGLEIDYPVVLSTGTQITSVNTPLEEYLKYVFDFGIAIGFFAAIISLLVAGVLYFLSPAIPGAKEMAKDRITGATTGLLILVLLYLIITTINPNLAIFKSDELEPVPVTEEQESPGVYFYKEKSCMGESQANNSSIRDLGDDLNNKIQSVKIVQGGNDESYISVLYQYPDYWGKCLYVNPAGKCSGAPAFATSASIHKYDFTADGKGVYIYRKSFFDDGGGYVHITNSQIQQNGLYANRLDNMWFTGEGGKCTVPEKEQVCIRWNEKGACIQKGCPNLAGENISSIKIDGNYIVMLIYYNPFELTNEENNLTGLWNYCQEFPGKNDADKNGPEQIKWDNIRQTGRLPNFIGIIPIEQ